MSVTFQHRDRDFRAWHAGDFTGEFTGLMRSMRELEPEHIPPERERTIEVRDGDAGVISGDNAKGVRLHVVKAYPSLKLAS